MLLLPPAYREALPWERVLVPVSGEPEADEALAPGVRLADALDLAVHLVQVITQPILLVKPEARVPFRLKVGEAIE